MSEIRIPVPEPGTYLACDSDDIEDLAFFRDVANSGHLADGGYFQELGNAHLNITFKSGTFPGWRHEGQ